MIIEKLRKQSASDDVVKNLITLIHQRADQVSVLGGYELVYNYPAGVSQEVISEVEKALEAEGFSLFATSPTSTGISWSPSGDL